MPKILKKQVKELFELQRQKAALDKQIKELKKQAFDDLGVGIHASYGLEIQLVAVKDSVDYKSFFEAHYQPATHGDAPMKTNTPRQVFKAYT